jgi:hypothetical protein
MINLHEDLHARMAPSATNVTEAVAALTEAGTKMAMVPLAFPAKEYGIWCDDTIVLNPPGAFPCNNDDSYHAARSAAELVAVKAMGERPGTVGYVVVYPSGEWSVWEEILTPADILKYAAIDAR